MDRIRFAQLSFWFMHAHGICAAAERHPNVDLACIWDDDPARGRAAAEKFGVEYIGDLDEVLAVSDRIGVINRGRIVGEFDAPADRHVVGGLMVGHA